MRTRLTALTAGIAACTAAAALIGAGAADAASRVQTIGMQCYGANPNVLGFPFYGGANITTNAPWPGQITINSDSKDVLPYTTDTTVRVTSLRTNRTQTFHRRWQHTMGDDSGYMISGIRASGRVRVSVSAVNHGLFQTVSGPTCTGVVTV